MRQIEFKGGFTEALFRLSVPPNLTAASSYLVFVFDAYPIADFGTALGSRRLHLNAVAARGNAVFPIDMFARIGDGVFHQSVRVDVEKAVAADAGPFGLRAERVYRSARAIHVEIEIVTRIPPKNDFE